jgi:hypothetical protein
VISRISQADGARLMAAHEKAVEANGDYHTCTADAALWRKRWQAAEKAFAELVSELTMPEGE